MFLDVLQSVHQLCVSKKRVEFRANVNSEAMLEMVSRWVVPEVAEGIVHSLQDYYGSNDVQVTCFRASIVYSLIGDECFWPVVELREGDDTEVIAFFYVDDYAVPEA